MTNGVMSAAAGSTGGRVAGGSGSAAPLTSTGRTARPRRMGGNTSGGKLSLHCCSLYWGDGGGSAGHGRGVVEQGSYSSTMESIQ